MPASLATLTPEEKRQLAEVLYGEAGGEGPRGQRAVLDVILNRARVSGQSIPEVLNTVGQFESWDTPAARAKLEALSSAQLGPEYGVIDAPNPAPVVGPEVMYFYNPALQAKLGRGTPSFARDAQGIPLGNQVFFPGQYKGGPQMAISGAPAAGAPGGLSGVLQQALQSFQTGSQPLVKQAEEAGAAAQQRLGQLSSADQALQERLGQIKPLDTSDIPEVPKAEKEPALEGGDPARVLGQTLPMLAILGGALMRTHALGALSAATGAMKAAKEGDEAALQREHQRWLDNMTAIRQQYEDSLKRHQEAVEAHKENVSDLLAAFQVNSAQRQDTLGQAQLAAGNLKNYLDAQSVFFNAAATASTIGQRAEQIAAEQERIPPTSKAYNDVYASEKARGASDDAAREAAAKAAGDVKREMTPGFIQSLGEREERIINADPAIKQYRTDTQYMNNIEDLEKDPGKLANGPNQVVLLDSFTRLATNQAIRRFMVDSATKYQGLIGQAEVLAAQNATNKAPFLTDAQKQMYLSAAGDMLKELRASYSKEMALHAQHMQDRGIDPAIAIGGDDLDAAVQGGFKAEPGKWSVSDAADRAAEAEEAASAPSPSAAPPDLVWDPKTGKLVPYGK